MNIVIKKTSGAIRTIANGENEAEVPDATRAAGAERLAMMLREFSTRAASSPRSWPWPRGSCLFYRLPFPEHQLFLQCHCLARASRVREFRMALLGQPVFDAVHDLRRDSFRALRVHAEARAARHGGTASAVSRSPQTG